MDFALTEEQALLQNSVDRFLTERHDFETARRIMKTADGFSRDLWSGLAELGLPGLLAAEADGGLGGSLIEAAIIAEVVGRHLAAVPFASSAVLATRLLAAAPDGAPARALLGRAVAGAAVVAVALEEPGTGPDLAPLSAHAARGPDGFRLTGRKIVVLDGAIADDFIVSAALDGGLALFHVAADTAGLGRAAYRTIDGRAAADLDLAGVALPAAALIAGPPQAEAALAGALDAVRLVLAAEALGIMETAIAVTVDYLKTRSQFGRRLADFQVMAHRVSDMVVKTESARSMLYRGLSLAGAEPGARARAVSATMVRVLQSAEFVAAQAIQLHGGMGMSDETIVGHLYKRLRVIGKSYGDEFWHMNRFMGTAANGRAAA